MRLFIAYGFPILIILGCALLVWAHVMKSRRMRRAHQERLQRLHDDERRVRQQLLDTIYQLGRKP